MTAKWKKLSIKTFFFHCYVILSTLCLQIERDTFGKLQCHPYPHEFLDTSKQCAHCAFFMGLQRKQGEMIQEGQQFDIRGTVDEFKRSVNMFMGWKPGMEIFVFHVRRRQIPSYVFPDGYKRSRPSRLTAHKLSNGCSEVGGTGSGERCLLKRKKDSDAQSLPRKQQSISPWSPESVSPESGTSSGERCLERKNDTDVQGVLEKGLSISPQRQDTISPEIISNKFIGMSPEHLASHALGNKANNSKVEGLESNGSSARAGSVRKELHWIKGDKGSDRELAEAEKGMLWPESDTACTPNSSITTTLTSEGSSCEGGGFGSVVGSCEGNTGSVGDSIEQITNLGSSLGELCEAHSVLPLENGYGSCNGVSQDGFPKELEVQDFKFLHFPCVSFFYLNCMLILITLYYASRMISCFLSLTFRLY